MLIKMKKSAQLIQSNNDECVMMNKKLDANCNSRISNHEVISMPFSSVSEAISWGAKMLLESIGDASLAERESKWLLESSAVSAGRDPLFLNQPDLTARVSSVFRSHIARRSRGEPLSYVIGEASFRGIDLFVTSDVLIPRPETEQLVDEILKLIPKAAEWQILDQGTGSGAIAIAVALERKLVHVTGIDKSTSAIDIAKKNVKRYGLENRIDIIEADIFPKEGLFDMIIANLPYVPDKVDLPKEITEWEPVLALRGGPTGMEVINRSIELSNKFLKPNGLLIYEIGEEQESGFREHWQNRFEFKKDLNNKIRFMIDRG